MKKHSPNFFDNLQEADTAKNNRATTFFWAVVLVATFMLGLSLTSCTNNTNKTIGIDTTSGQLIKKIQHNDTVAYFKILKK